MSAVESFARNISTDDDNSIQETARPFSDTSTLNMPLDDKCDTSTVNMSTDSSEAETVQAEPALLAPSIKVVADPMSTGVAQGSLGTAISPIMQTPPTTPISVKELPHISRHARAGRWARMDPTRVDPGHPYHKVSVARRVSIFLFSWTSRD